MNIVRPSRTSMLCVLLVSITFLEQLLALGQGTAFTYQGRLNDGAGPANGLYDLRFRLASDPLANNYVGGPVLTNGLPVSGGLFTVTLDFGAGLFTGSNYWMEVDVKTNNAGSYTVLTPLQALTPTPYAIFANTASNLSGTLAVAQLNGAVLSTQLSGTYSGAVTLSNASDNFNGTFTGDGTSVSNVNATTLNGLSSANFWKTNGNAGANPTNGAFLGTTDNLPLELKVGNSRVLRLEPNTATGAPNVIGGASLNFVSSGTFGATISGGGATNFGLNRFTNGVMANFGTIGGGAQNTLQGGSSDSIGGGFDNTIQTVFDATIGGGDFNTIQSLSTGSTIGGGEVNTIETNLVDSTIAGGTFNTNSGPYAAIPGGDQNVAGTNSFAAGHRAKAAHTGSFVWADATDADFGTTGFNQFLIRASGGVGIGKTNPATALDVSGTVTATSFSGSGAALGGVAPGFGSPNYIQNQSGANQPAGFRITGNGIFNGGNVGIGITNPSTALHVRDTGDTEISIESVQGGERWTLQSSGTSTPGKVGSFQIIDRTATASRLLIDTNGNVGIGIVPTNKLHVAGGVSATAFVSTSDRNAKENFAPVSPSEVLEKVVALPIATWNFKELHDGRHMGPMAQDFYAAFHLGSSETTITTVDPDGVALAAIQGLNQRVESADDQIKDLKAENTKLKARLEKIEHLLEKQRNE